MIYHFLAHFCAINAREKYFYFLKNYIIKIIDLRNVSENFGTKILNNLNLFKRTCLQNFALIILYARNRTHCLNEQQTQVLLAYYVVTVHVYWNGRFSECSMPITWKYHSSYHTLRIILPTAYLRHPYVSNISPRRKS